jgi:hypothetical protein
VPIFLRILIVWIIFRLVYSFWRKRRQIASQEARRGDWAASEGVGSHLPVQDAVTRAAPEESAPGAGDKPVLAAYQFWALIDDIHAETGFDWEKKEAVFKQRLSSLSADELRAVRLHFEQAMVSAYDWRLWAAAYVIHGGCSDDGFSDFRSTIIMLGRRAFEAALKDPDTLLEAAQAAGGDLQYENFSYPITEVFERETGQEIGANPVLTPAHPTGEDWEEEDLPRVVPALWAAYGH